MSFWNAKDSRCIQIITNNMDNLSTMTGESLYLEVYNSNNSIQILTEINQ